MKKGLIALTLLLTTLNAFAQTTQLTFDNFDNNIGNWNDGGNDCSRGTYSDGCLDNSGKIRLRDNSGTSSSLFSNPYDLTDYDEITIDFEYFVTSFEGSENWLVEFSSDNGSSWSIIKNYIVDVDFTENICYNETLTITASSQTFNTQNRIRFRADASGNNDELFIDDILVTGVETCATASASFTASTTNVGISQTVTFTNTSVGADSYVWDFGDGSNTSTDVNPTHVYTTVGTYTVTLTATGCTGGPSTATETITVVSCDTNLSPGDIAITGYLLHGHSIDVPFYNDDQANGAFSFVLLTDVSSGEEIIFTDYGVKSDGTTLKSGESNEGSLTWQANTNLASGTEVFIILDHDGGVETNVGTVSSSEEMFFDDDGNGDQILAYQESVCGTKTFLYAVNFGDEGWTNDKNDDSETAYSALPSGLQNNNTALDLYDNNDGDTKKSHAVYNCGTSTGAAATVLAAISNTNNWDYTLANGADNSGNAWFELGTCGFSFQVTTIWNGSAWSNGTPDINADAVISADYSEAGTDPSFSCKSLTVDAGVTCRVRNNKYIEIETDITVAGNLVVKPYGAIVQNSANGTVTVTGDGKIQNEKITAPSNNYYEYTYWSSPMTSTTYNNTFPDVSTQSRYTFNAANYADGNGDSFDDNGDAWVGVGGNTVWTPGRGYTGYPDPEVFNAGDGTLKFTFEGVFNNGTIDVPVYRNDEHNTDANSNLLGNPYPSAIDVNAFFTENEFNGIETPSNDYVSSSADITDDDGITNVTFNTINNSHTNQPSVYQDFTAIETTLMPGQSYDLSVNVNTNGEFQYEIRAWIDWNLDGDFTDAGEVYDLGTAFNNSNITTTNSPLAVTVPSDAVSGKRVMRVTAKSSANNPIPNPDDTNFYGEVEDYSIIIGGGKSLDAIVYLWSQNTALNAGQFSTSDYAYINKGGALAGGDGVTPGSYIPSGQGFFVNFSDSAVPTNGQGTVRFTNSMRSTGNNSQFFRNTTNNDADNDEVFVNKLRLNLTSDNGVFNQILVAYMNEATDLDDGLAYDAPRRLETGAASYLYSLQNDDATKQYAIQAKNDTSLDLSEVIKIGYTTSIEQATIYSLKLADIVEISDEDSFFSNVPIYIKDNLTGAMHDLKIGPYNFTSESGTYNERFEIVFQADTLGIEDVEANENALKIIESRNGDVRFLFNGSQTMSSIEIFDVQGRAIYNFRPNKTDVTYKLSNLRQAPFIARIVLDNDVVITKKAIKRY
ncbi:GEVED domain-containing protein [Winogradskyella sp. KYW1333]|uniref:GEVED domain-containing protein n=1 Tax=Winogradskyella sp. KYW1333 TaxID=2282123 RepID=UPI000DF1F22C|nr:GEVED domain-containing protein [Winogradskyella sp. KYW1333]RCT54754.1 PKD domain-containing protein [Winogradskyella sp. KYW1333]